MTRPQIIRADTLDLQDKSSPTAQDHSRQPEHPAPLGTGPAAPHQEATLRQVTDDRQEEEAQLQSNWNGANITREDANSDDEHSGDQNMQRDEQAVRLNGGDGEMQDADAEEDLDDDMMDKISSSPSIDDEDIDFEFVYALHTFVATVEGQANATKGDTMVLLDDSNSYWWLVRVVKDSSIGYLPAEHIETPTERLARLNKHRNIDLSATMLGDTAEKSKNPLKKAMRRRNAKTVQFAPPTYVEASDYDYSSDEGDDDDEELFGGADPAQDQAEAASEKPEAEEDDLKVQPLKLGGKKEEKIAGPESPKEPAKTDDSRTSDEIFDRPIDPKVSRNGTMRNTDSFFKDDNVETRKITLTPNLLRDDSSTSTTGSRERGPSLESLEKNGFADKVKEDKKKKEKKSGMLSGLFKRKDKKSKGGSDSIDSDVDGKPSEEPGRNSPQSNTSLEERQSTEQASPQRQPSKGKLQKSHRSRDESPGTVKGILKTDSPESATTQAEGATSPQKETATREAADAQRETGSKSTGPPTMRLVTPEREEAESPAERIASPDTRSTSTTSKLNPINILKGQQDGEPKPEKVTKAKQRVQLDDFDSDDEKNDPFADPKSGQAAAPQPNESEPSGRLSESPVHISAADAQPSEKEVLRNREQEPDSQHPDSQHPPGLTADTSSQETPSPVSTPTPGDSPSTTVPPKGPLSDAVSPVSPAAAMLPPSRPAPIPTKDIDISPPISSESTSLPAWSDSSLRTYLDDGSDIRDMLLVINDTTGVVPVGPEHPIMSQLFVEESKMVTQLGGQLDVLLTKWLETKRRKKQNGVPAKLAR